MLRRNTLLLLCQILNRFAARAQEQSRMQILVEQALKQIARESA